MSQIGHNSEGLQPSAMERLRSIVERLESLNEDKATVSNDITEVFAEAKGEGFDTKIIRKVLAYRKMDKARRLEEEALVETYLNALGLL